MTRIDVHVVYYESTGLADTSAYARLEPGAQMRLMHLAEGEPLATAECFLPTRIAQLERFLREGLGIEPEIRNGGTDIISAAS